MSRRRSRPNWPPSRNSTWTWSRASARNVDTAIPRAAALKFLRHTPKIGIRPSTFTALANQLIAERRKPWLSTRRRSFQSIFAFDLFDKQLERHRPVFSTFFTNHVASAMHRYWAAGHPSDYEQLDLDDEWMDKYRDEVPWAMAQADEMIGRLAAFAEANPDYEIVDCLQHGTGPDLRPAAGNPALPRRICRPSCRWSAACRRTKWTERPAMRPQCNVSVDAEYADAFERALRTVTVADAPLGFRRADNGFFSMEWGQANLHDSPDAVRVDGEAGCRRASG